MICLFGCGWFLQLVKPSHIHTLPMAKQFKKAVNHLLDQVTVILIVICKSSDADHMLHII